MGNATNNDLLTADRLRAVAPDAGTDVIGESA